MILTFVTFHRQTRKTKIKKKNHKFKLNNNLCITLNLNYPDCCFSLTKQQTLDIQSTSFFCAVLFVWLLWRLDEVLRLKNQQINVSCSKSNESE